MTAAKIANASVCLAKLSYLPRVESQSGTTATKYDLGNTVINDWKPAIQVFRNGQLCKKVSSSPADESEWTVADDGTSGITAITFGSAPNGDALTFQYVA